MGLDLWFSKEKRYKWFRKVNFLVKYFEDKGESLMDEDSSCEVSREDVEDLIDRCNKVLKDHSLAEKLLPTRSGFFFGSTEYDDNYFRKVKDVHDFLEFELIPEMEQLKDDEIIKFNIWY